ncbi:hypothetical protein ABZ208_24370 [Streptomyces sp. NPDC006208]|uniref:hypothetical protein n=1 Tax=Streptomyces sp. NPDC006208 TaxID=3156734 RepID=UPI0033A1CF98
MFTVRVTVFGPALDMLKPASKAIGEPLSVRAAFASNFSVGVRTPSAVDDMAFPVEPVLSAVPPEPL